MEGCSDSYDLGGNVLTVEDASIGNGLSLRDSIYLLTSSSDTISRFEQPIPQVPSGYSIERINYQVDRWGVSRIQGGTPNRVNSIYSLSLLIIDSLFLRDESLFVRIRNMSPSPVSETLFLIVSDTLRYPLYVEGDSYAIVGVPLDTLSFLVGFSIGDFHMEDYIPVRYPTLVINEIEYDESPEWVEIFNSTGMEVDIDAFYLMDMSGNMVRLSGNLSPSDYGVFSAEDYPDFPSLNNNYETLLLKNRWGMVFDTVYYSSSYGGEGPYTLEKVNPYLAGWERSSWGSSRLIGGTPGTRNSQFVSQDRLLDRLSVDPRYPHPGQDVILTFNLGKPTGRVEILLLDDLGRLVDRLLEGRNHTTGVVTFKAPSRKGIYIILIRTDSESLRGWFRVR